MRCAVIASPLAEWPMTCPGAASGTVGSGAGVANADPPPVGEEVGRTVELGGGVEELPALPSAAVGTPPFCPALGAGGVGEAARLPSAVGTTGGSVGTAEPRRSGLAATGGTGPWLSRDRPAVAIALVARATNSPSSSPVVGRLRGLRPGLPTCLPSRVTARSSAGNRLPAMASGRQS